MRSRLGNADDGLTFSFFTLYSKDEVKAHHFF